MKKNIIFIVILLAIISGVLILIHNNSNLKNKYQVAVANNKAYEAQLTEQKKVFQFTIDQLNYINDSTIKELDSLRKELKIKDKQIMQMGKIKERIYIVNTLKHTDTIFKEPDFSLDTCLGDKWYTNCLHLAYPNHISSELDVNTDLNCFIYAKKETINPPCKTWIGRLFQKKHTVINVNVVENNPHSNVKELKFIKILDK